MTEQRTNHRKTEASRSCNTRERMTEIVDTHGVETCLSTNSVPRLLQVNEVSSLLRTNDDVRVVIVPTDSSEYLHCGW